MEGEGIRLVQGEHQYLGNNSDVKSYRQGIFCSFAQTVKQVAKEP